MRAAWATTTTAGPAFLCGQPQNPASTIPLDLNKIPELLQNPTCNDFVSNLINKAAELDPNNPANSSNALDLFNAIKNGKGGYFLQSFSFDGKPAGGTIGGSIANGDAKVYIAPRELARSRSHCKI